jgi:enediyne biosynthesis protein E4
MRQFLRRHAAKLATGCLVLTLYSMSVPQDLPADEWNALAARFQFEKFELFPASNGQPLRFIRGVHPALQHVSAWISAVGASVAFADVDGIGRPADICLVDPRNNSVTLMPAPGTGSRYEPIALPLPAEGFDPATIAPMGCLPADVNEDGRLDLVVYFWGRTPIAYLQTGEGALSGPRFLPVEIVPTRERWFTNAALFIDVDGDGHPDLVFGNYYRDGDRILDPRATDVVDLQHSMSRAYNGGRNRLLLWQSAAPDTVTFRDASDAFSSDMANGWTLALAAADLTGDLLPEIYVANDFGPDRLLLNKSVPGKPAFEIVEGERDLFTPRSKVLGRDSFKGMGVDFADITGTGRFAIAVSNISETYGLLESHFLFVHTGDETAWSRGIAPYRDESVPRGTWTGGWAWDVKFADLDNSGVPQILQAVGFTKGKNNRWPQLQELAMGNDELLRYPALWPSFGPDDDLSGVRSHDHLFVADAKGRYHDIWPRLGLDRATVSRAIAVADVYGDGRLAVAIARQWMASIFLRNTSTTVGHWLVLDLRLPGAVAGTRPAIGAIARIKLPDGRIVVSQVDGGSGHGGRRAPEIHVGLGRGAFDPEVKADIAWRDGSGVHRMSVRVPIDRRHLIMLGSNRTAQTEVIRSPR